MTDPITVVAAGTTAARGGLGLVEFLWDKGRDADVLAALFDPDGARIEGSDRIQINRIPGSTEGQWWYRPVLIAGFELIPYATNPYLGVREIGRATGGQLRARDRLVWRWVEPPPLGFVFNANYDPVNAETNFVVVGYKPSAIVKHFMPSKK